MNRICKSSSNTLVSYSMNGFIEIQTDHTTYKKERKSNDKKSPDNQETRERIQ